MCIISFNLTTSWGHITPTLQMETNILEKVKQNKTKQHATLPLNSKDGKKDQAHNQLVLLYFTTEQIIKHDYRNIYEMYYTK